jgi:hypothetical protein
MSLLQSGMICHVLLLNLSISVQTGWNSSILERLLSIEGTTMYQVILGSMKTVVERSNNSYARIISAAYDFGW